MKKLLALLSIILVFLLTGCDMLSFQGVDIMCPPKATGNKAQIQKLIDKQTKGNYTLKFPKSGANRSSIIIHDIDNDEEQEAIAFYSDKEGDHIHALFFECENENYSVISDIELEAAGIDAVNFADLNGDRIFEILIGYSNSTSSQNVLNVYSYSDSIEKYDVSYTYSSFVSGDFNNNQNDDVLLISLYSGDIAAKATLLTYNEDSLTEIGATELDSDITALANVQYGQISYGNYGAVIDGVSSAGDYTTQVVIFDKDAPALLNPLFSYSGYSTTRRSTQICSLDYDKDELIDIPLCSLMPHKESEDITTVSRRVDWSNFDTDTYALSTAKSSIICPKDGYFLTMPQKWNDSVTARYNESTRETTVYSVTYSANALQLKEKIITIKAYFDEDYSKDNSGFTEFLRAGSTVYTYSMGDCEEYLSVSGEEIKSLFKLINQ